jgi:hypothetical protein
LIFVISADEPSNDTLSEEEAAKRRDEALKRALGMPHKPHKPKGNPPRKKARIKRTPPQ